MSHCSNCGAELDEEAKFCMECGTPIHQNKKCVQCGIDLPLKAKFCFSCGAPQNDEKSKPAGVNMGDKNVIAGDVIGQKIAGDNVGNKILGNATFTTIQDDTKRINTCAICGKHMTNDEGHSCPNCGKIVCVEHFNIDKCLCLACIKTKHLKAIESYHEFLASIAIDGRVKHKDLNHLAHHRKILGLTQDDTVNIDGEFCKSISVTVSADETGDFKTIKEALDYVDDGDTIVVKQGEYHEHFTVDKAITICGEQKGDKVPIIGDTLGNTDVCINIKAKATIKNLKVVSFNENIDHNTLDFSDGRFYAAINITDNAVLENVCIDSCFDDGFRICGEGVNPIIKKCSSIKNGGCGLVLANEALGTVCNCIFSNNNQYGILIKASTQCAIENCDIFGNKFSGIAIQDANTNPTIKGCKIHDGKQNGIWITSHAHGTIENCDIFGNEYPEIAIQDENTNPTVKGCKIHDGKQNGILIKTGAQGTIENCDIFGNGYPGIDIQDANTNPTVKGCKIHDGKQNGIWIKTGAQGTIENCDIFGNGYPGIEIQDANTNPTVKECKIHDGKQNGLRVFNGAKGSIEHCDFFKNNFSSFVIKDANTNPTITGCKFHDNASSGIYALDEAAGNIKNCSFTKNEYPIYIKGIKTYPSIKNCTYLDNAHICNYEITKITAPQKSCTEQLYVKNLVKEGDWVFLAQKVAEIQVISSWENPKNLSLSSPCYGVVEFIHHYNGERVWSGAPLISIREIR